jgi:hypothetical protein
MLCGCFLCEKKFSNGKTLNLPGLKGHHVDESKKKLDPGNLPTRSHEFMESELKKCIPLCRACHTKVTHIESTDRELKNKMSKRGYFINVESGIIGYDGDQKMGGKLIHDGVRKQG